MPHKVERLEQKWWREAVVYQVYPASFKDSNDDGIGDITGIISKLDYIRSLGVDVLWVCPHYKSPRVDMGYDISDFQDIHEAYGTLDDTDRLIREAHARGLRIIFDLVINHVSDQHPWFKEARSSKTSAKRDWFIWKPCRYDASGQRHPPTNWRSNFGGPTWTYDEKTEEYYFHIYAPEQPDLNWENVDLRKALYEEAILFWLKKGIDGFRVDTVNRYSKHPFVDAKVTSPSEDTQLAYPFFTNGPRIHEFISEINEVMRPFDVMTVGELPNTPAETDVLRFVSASNRQIDMVFNFDTVYLGQTPGDRFNLTKFTTKDFKREFLKWQHALKGTDGWPTVFLENHDQGRSISRFASDAPEHREKAGKMLSMILGTLTGTLYVYQGQEIGMINAPSTWAAEEYKCVRSKNHITNVLSNNSGHPAHMTDAVTALQKVARDHARVPMQWTSGPNAGFCSEEVRPWMSALQSSSDINVAEQEARPESLLNFWRNVIGLRRQYKSLFVYGFLDKISVGESVLCYRKSDEEHSTIIIANLTDLPQPLGLALEGYRLLLSNVKVTEGDVLGAYEARIYTREA